MNLYKIIRTLNIIALIPASFWILILFFGGLILLPQIYLTKTSLAVSMGLCAVWYFGLLLNLTVYKDLKDEIITLILISAGLAGFISISLYSFWQTYFLSYLSGFFQFALYFSLPVVTTLLLFFKISHIFHLLKQRKAE